MGEGVKSVNGKRELEGKGKQRELENEGSGVEWRRGSRSRENYKRNGRKIVGVEKEKRING